MSTGHVESNPVENMSSVALRHILAFHSRDQLLDNGYGPPSLSTALPNNQLFKRNSNSERAFQLFLRWFSA